MIDLTVDLALATAIVAHRGNVELLLPVLQPQARDLVRKPHQPGQPDFVIQIHRLVGEIALDPRYAAGFAGTQPRSPFQAPKTTPEARSSLWHAASHLLDTLRVKLTVWIARQFAPSLGPSTSEIVDPGAAYEAVSGDSEPKVSSVANLPTILPGDRMGECGYTMELVVRSVDGILKDASAAARGCCPRCLGKA
jgi:hypothetical protein